MPTHSRPQEKIDNQSWQSVMEKHGKSFFLASLFFPRQFYDKVRSLYALCRWIDDAADNAPSRHQSIENLQTILNDLRTSPSQLIPNQIYKLNNLNPGYVEDLLEGAADDLGEVRIKDSQQLVQYCYKVAGTVGLAMNDLMGVKDKRARAFAVDLGIAMQITNICRDVKEDAENGRVYIPESLLKKYDIKVEQLLQLQVNEEAISLVVKEMLQIADQYYSSARQSYIKIPWRMRGAIIMAGRLYRGIGQKLLRTGGNPFIGRTHLKKAEKATALAKGLGEWLFQHYHQRPIKHDHNLHRPLYRWKLMRGFDS